MSATRLRGGAIGRKNIENCQAVRAQMNALRPPTVSSLRWKHASPAARDDRRPSNGENQ
jgi:hypothetical protein